MNLTLVLTPVEEAMLLAKARGVGTTPEQVAREAIEPILGSTGQRKGIEPKPSLLGMWAQYGSGPSEEDIDQNRAEMFALFGRCDMP